mmetsp:Transcript_1728/g.3193  ORF Transcript_1728/g.3193 Transcript_1728/m.3193 type:complete len:122 (+) Transcript_1728:190-555(+)
MQGRPWHKFEARYKCYSSGLVVDLLTMVVVAEAVKFLFPKPLMWTWKVKSGPKVCYECKLQHGMTELAHNKKGMNLILEKVRKTTMQLLFPTSSWPQWAVLLPALPTRLLPPLYDLLHHFL